MGKRYPPASSPVPTPGPQGLRSRVKGGGARVSAGQTGLQPRTCLPSPYPRNRGHLFEHQLAGFELSQRKSGVGKGEGPWRVEGTPFSPRALYWASPHLAPWTLRGPLPL